MAMQAITETKPPPTSIILEGEGTPWQAYLSGLISLQGQSCTLVAMTCWDQNSQEYKFAWMTVLSSVCALFVTFNITWLHYLYRCFRREQKQMNIE